jgi:O-antigen ligase
MAAASLPRLRPARLPASPGHWDLLLVCVGAYVLTAVGRVHQLFPALQALRPAVLAGLLAIGLFATDRSQARRGIRLWCATTRWLLALLFWMALSVPGALVVGSSLDLVVDNFVKTVAMYLVIVGCVRGARDVERLTAVYLLGAVVYAAVVLLRFDVGGGEGWRLGRLYYYDANDFATFAVTAMPLALYFLHAPGRASRRALAAAGLGVLVVAFVRSGSRGGFVALVATGAFVLLRYRAVRLRWRLAALALVALALLGTASDTYWRQMGTIVSDTDYNHTEESGRLQIWWRGIGYMLQHPVLGVGPNNFAAAEGTLSPFAFRQQFGVGVRWNAAHNTFVQVGAELGVVGLALFLALVASAFAALRRAGRADPRVFGPAAPRAELSQAITAALIGFAVGAFFLSLAYAEMLYTLCAFAAALGRPALPSAHEEAA